MWLEVGYIHTYIYKHIHTYTYKHIHTYIHKCCGILFAMTEELRVDVKVDNVNRR